jgi:choline dehydrogenase-like flavoprotein
MGTADRAKASRLIRKMAEAYFAAGAEQVFFPVLGQAPLSADGAKSFPLEKVPGRKLECTSQHPLGSCQMGTERHSSGVDPEGRVWDVDNLFVADGSIMPTSLGVNPQLAIMAVATRVAWRMME